MQIDAEQRSATLGVGEFAGFRPYAAAGFGGVAALWRAQLGTYWHQRVQGESAAAGEAMQDEVPIAGALAWRGWTLHLRGRIDQLKRSGESIRLREIKTVNEPLPLPDEAIRERYLSYPLQLLTYRELMLRAEPALSPKDFQLELLFVEIGSGLAQSLRLGASHDGLFAAHLDVVADFLEAKRERLQRLRSLAVRPAYPTPRPGQENIQRELENAFADSRLAVLEAPTGYGKTGVAWEHALKRLAAGREERVLYLTSKSTGQTEAVERLRSILAAPPQSEISNLESQIDTPLAFWQIRNKQEHCIHTEFRCSSQTCPYLADLEEKWKSRGLSRLYALSRDEIGLDILKAEGRAAGICPYEIMRAGLGFRDVWIGDYNYLFSPHSARLLDDQADFAPERTFLIVDEAHNLPSRVATAFTYDIDLRQAYAAADELREARGSARLQAALKSLAATIGSLEPKTEAPAPLERDFHEQLAQIAESLQSEPLAYDELGPETSEFLFLAAAAHASQKRGELQHLLWSPAPGLARLECIDASKLIAARLRAYSGVLFLSATLTPLESFLEETGLAEAASNLRSSPAAIPHLSPPAPWRDEAYDVAIDLRVDTRFRARASSLPKTAAAIAAAAAALSSVVAFFPSYAYAEKALAQLQLSHPFLRVELQPRSGGSLAERAAYLESALAFNDALFLILGSSYAEGIDTLGGKARCAIVVGPGLPEMNLIQEAKRARRDALARDGFERAYLEPGIQKVNQALGRLVRAPGQKVKALLHCHRFGEPQTRRLLDPLYQTKTYIHTDADLQAWLESPQSSSSSS